MPGDTVAIVAPSGPVDPAALDRGRAIFESWGLRVHVGDHVYDTDRYLAGTDQQRAEDLQAAWCDDEVAALVCARGGYGAQRMVDLLDWTSMADAGPKVLLGSSDVTVLHEAVAAHLGLVSLFGPMPAGSMLGALAPHPITVDHLRATLFVPEQVQRITGPKTRAVVPGLARGRLVGGTLALLAATLGTPESRPGAGGIVVLEDVGEVPYKVDRLLTTLLRAGWFDGARGIVIGDFTDCGDPDDVRAVLTDRLRPLGIPMLDGIPFGHGPVVQTIPLGVVVELDADSGTIQLAEPALS